MKKLILVLLTFLFIGKCFANGQQTEQQVPSFDPRAIVVLGYLDWRHDARGATKWPRVAFALGDGTLLLTAAHCVSDFQNNPDGPASINTVVISPYYGDVYDFEIAAIDKNSDLAILKAPWASHPAMSLASEQEYAAAKEILIASRPQDNPDNSFHFGRKIRTELLQVFRKDEKNPARGLWLKETKLVAPGWSGSPMLISKSGNVAGVLGQLVPMKKKLFGLVTLSSRKDACGCNLLSIKTLIEKGNLESAAFAPTPKLDDIPDAEHSFNLALDFFEAPFIKEASKAFQIAKEFLQTRPDSVQAHLLMAFSATLEAKNPNVSESEFLNQAEVSYKKALELDSNNAYAHASYGNFLLRTQREEEALEQCNASLAIDPNNRMALINKLTLLTRNNPTEAKEIALRLTTIEPNDPFFWFYYSEALSNLKEYEEALEAAQKSVAIDPNGKFYGCLADSLVNLKRFDEAEPYYKLMTERCGCQQCWFNYANFLIGHYPEKLDEASKALEQAELKSRERRISKENINLLKLYLLEKTAPQEAEVLARELLETSPDNGSYWFLFAGILRTLEKYEQAVEAAQKAVDLNPERSYRPRLANCLAKIGELEKAEQIFHELHKEYPERNKYWYWYAKILLDYFPDRIAEAQEAIDKASSNPDKDWFVSEDELQELQEKINEKAAASPIR